MPAPMMIDIIYLQLHVLINRDENGQLNVRSGKDYGGS